jgi:FdhD protein
MVEGGTVNAHWHKVERDWKREEGEVIEESLMTIYVNAVELATIMCSPREQELLALGYLKNEGVIEGLEEVALWYKTMNGCCVDLWLNKPVKMPRRLVITSGCGGGVTSKDPELGIEPLPFDDMRIEPGRLFALFSGLHFPDSLHARARGVHGAGLADGDQMLLVTEDIGRHNTVDKLVGACMLQGIDTRGKILLATGRISSEMLRKGAMMGCPIIASRNSPTSMAVEMAEAWNITLVGYARNKAMRVYTHPKRLGYKEPTVLRAPDG